jgi:adenylate cyclase
MIRDHNSANGTFINEHPVDVCQHLKNKDRIQLGTVLLEFYDEVEITPFNYRELMQTHPAFAAHFTKKTAMSNDPMQPISSAPPIEQLPRPSLSSIHDENDITDVSVVSDPAGTHRASMSARDKHLSLVTILPSEQKYEETIMVRAELNGESQEEDFQPADSIKDTNVLRDDYEKLRLAYELSKLGLTEINPLLERMLDLMFSVLPVDRGVVMLVDRKTGMLTTEKVKLRTEKNTELEHKEILLSGTILKKVFTTKRCLITSDAFEDPELGKAQSITKNSIRSVICVPLIAHNQVRYNLIHRKF